MSDDTVDKVAKAIRDGIFSDAGNRHIARECIALIEEPLRAENEKLRAALKAIMIDAALTTYKDNRTNVCLVGRNVLSDAALLLKENGHE